MATARRRVAALAGVDRTGVTRFFVAGAFRSAAFGCASDREPEARLRGDTGAALSSSTSIQILRGAPAIVSGHGGFVETIEPGVAGLHLPPGDVEALASCIGQLATGRAFAPSGLPDPVVHQARATYGLDAHVERLRRRLDQARR